MTHTTALLPQKSALVEALAFKLRVLLDAEDAATRGSKPADQTGAAAPAAAEATPSAAQAEGSPPAKPAPAAQSATASADDSTAVAGAAGPSSSQIEEAHRWAGGRQNSRCFVWTPPVIRRFRQV